MWSLEPRGSLLEVLLRGCGRPPAPAPRRPLRAARRPGGGQGRPALRSGVRSWWGCLRLGSCKIFIDRVYCQRLYPILRFLKNILVFCCSEKSLLNLRSLQALRSAVGLQAGRGPRWGLSTEQTGRVRHSSGGQRSAAIGSPGARCPRRAQRHGHRPGRLQLLCFARAPWGVPLEPS